MFPAHAIPPSDTMHVPDDVLTIEVTVHPGPGTQAKLLMNPIPLWFRTVSWYLPEAQVCMEIATSVDAFAA